MAGGGASHNPFDIFESFFGGGGQSFGGMFDLCHVKLWLDFYHHVHAKEINSQASFFLHPLFCSCCLVASAILFVGLSSVMLVQVEVAEAAADREGEKMWCILWRFLLKNCIMGHQRNFHCQGMYCVPSARGESWILLYFQLLMWSLTAAYPQSCVVLSVMYHDSIFSLWAVQDSLFLIHD